MQIQKQYKRQLKNNLLVKLINPISIERIDFTKKKGNIKGIDLDRISNAFLNSDLFKYRPPKNNLEDN